MNYYTIIDLILCDIAILGKLLKFSSVCVKI